MRPILFAAALAAVATMAQAQATWSQQRFAEAGIAAEAPVALAFQSQQEDAGWVMRSYIGRAGGDLFLVVGGRRTGAASYSDAEEARADVDNFVKAFPGAVVVSRRAGPGANQHEMVFDQGGRRFWFRTTHAHPRAISATYATPLPVGEEQNRTAARFIGGAHILP